MQKIRMRVKENLQRLREIDVPIRGTYEQVVSEALGFKDNRGRYGDAEYDGHVIEFKKGGTHWWLDLKRYLEYETAEPSERSHCTLFLQTNAEGSVFRVAVVPNDDVVRILKLHDPAVQEAIKHLAETYGAKIAKSRGKHGRLNALVRLNPTDIPQRYWLQVRGVPKRGRTRMQR